MVVTRRRRNDSPSSDREDGSFTKSAKTEGDTVVESSSSRHYEQIREERMKENAERMQKHGLLKLSLELKKVKKPPRPYVKKIASPDEPERRSSRIVEKGKPKSPPKPKKEIAEPDPNKPKRPPSAFFVFLEDVRKIFKAENPNCKNVSLVAKAGGESWKSMTEAEKAPYEAKAAERKVEYEQLMIAYNNKAASSVEDDEEESDKSKSEVNNEDEASGEDDHQDDDDEDDEEDDEEDDD